MAQVSERNDAGAKVVVACKLPAGLVLRAYKENLEYETVLGGGTREFKMYRWSGELGDQQEIYGTAVPMGKTPKCLFAGGYALTPNVSKDLWDNWYSFNKDSKLVKERLIFAHERDDQVRGLAKDHESTQSGFEPIDIDNPGKKVGGIEKAIRK